MIFFIYYVKMVNYFENVKKFDSQLKNKDKMEIFLIRIYNNKFD